MAKISATCCRALPRLAPPDGRAWGLGLVLCTFLLSLAGRAAAQDQPAGCVEQAEPPIQVCYDRPADRSRAEALLAQASAVWDIEVKQMGLSAPWRVDAAGQPEEGARILLTDLGEMAAGYSLSVADITATAHSDCASEILLNTRMPDYYLPQILCHEFAHAAEAADDCIEPLHEAFAPYVEMLCTIGAGFATEEEYLSENADYYISTFQENPNFSLDFSDNMSRRMMMYRYGHILFAMYLDERWGDGNGKLIGEIARASRQDGTVVINELMPFLEAGDNEPDVYDGIDTVLQARGGSFWQAVGEFAVWRLLTGERADAEHLRLAAELPSVAVDTELRLSQAPHVDLEPEQPVLETGTAYVRLELDGDRLSSDQDRLVFSLAGAAGAGWHVAAVVLGQDGVLRLDAAELTGSGTLETSGLTSAHSVIFAVTSLGDRVHDVDHADWNDQAFRYGIDLINQPVITAVEPGQAVQGEQRVAVAIHGRGFGEGLAVSFDAGITVTDAAIDRSGEKILAILDVAADAPVGWHALRLSYPNGIEALLEHGLEVQSGAGPVLAAVLPAQARQGQQLFVELRGSRLRAGTTVTFSGGGITVLRNDLVDEQTMMLELAIAADAAPGARDVTLGQQDGKSFTLAGAFTVLRVGGGGSEGGGKGGGDDDGGCRLASRGAGHGSGSGALLCCGVLLLLGLRSAGRRGAPVVRRRP